MPTELNPKHAVVWSQPNCPGCNTAKALLAQQGYDVEVKMLDGTELTKEDLFRAVPGARSVPQVFINGELVGGLNELVKVLKGDSIKTTKVV